MTKLNFNSLIKLRLLLSIDGIGPGKVRNLLSGLRSLDNIFTADYDTLISIPGISSTIASRIVNSKKSEPDIRKEIEKDLIVLQRLKGRIITIWDKEYPSILKKIFDPPLLIYMKGIFEVQDNFNVAVVGTRKPTNYGIVQCERITEGLSSRGITIVSGLARGIDSIAHTTALKNNGRTIAVIGSGLDVIYPPENRRLFNEITEHGAIISEFPPGTKPDAQNFPRRNRIISGLSLGTVIIETGLTGGAMQTAALALDQNREVFAVPGNLLVKQSEGTNRMIQKGEAKLIKNAEDVIVELELKLKPLVSTVVATPKINLTLFEERIMNSLQEKELQIDEISTITEIPVSDCLVNLLSLEFKGVVKQLPGKIFSILN